MLVCGDGMVIRQTLKPLFTITGPSSRALGRQKFSDIFLLIFSWDLEWDSCCVQCPGKFQNRERGIEFFRSRKIIKLVFI